MKHAIKLVLKEGTTFDLYYSDGVVMRFDILSIANEYPEYYALKDRYLFLQGHLIGWGGVSWNDELDLSVDYPFYHGKDVTKEYDDVENVVLGYKLKEKRLELELSQKELASKVLIDQSDLSKIETGAANPSLNTISRIAEGLGCKLSIDFLFDKKL